MSCEDGTSGWRKFETFLSALGTAGILYVGFEKRGRVLGRGPQRDHVCACGCEGQPTACDCCLGICTHQQMLRLAKFTISQVEMIVEEYLADRDYDGEDIVEIAVYQEGRRPNLTTRELKA